MGVKLPSPAGVSGQHPIHSCFQQQVAVWFRSQRMNVASWYSAPSTKTCTSRIQSLACFDRLVMAPEVIFERLDCLARRCQWKKKALDTLVLSAAGRGVVQVAAHERCVLVQCTIHNNLHFKNSRIQSLACCFDSWPWRLKVSN